MKKGDLVYYTGEYDECHSFIYRITYVYKNGFGFDWWYDLESVEPNILTHYTIIWSVLKIDVTPTNELVSNPY